MSFAEVERVGSLLRDLRCEWFGCGGWAIDLFLGRATRVHSDVDIAIARRDQTEVRDYLMRRGWELEKAVDGVLSPWEDGETLALPVLAPEIVLLYKSSRPEEYAADFRNAAGSLPGESRAWLRGALDKVFARHPWADEL